MDWENITPAQYEKWASAQRTAYRYGRLSSEIAAACEFIPGWSWDFKNTVTFLPFEEARAFVWTLKLSNRIQWRIYSKSGKRPDNVPAQPKQIYANDWLNWPNWLGTATTPKQTQGYRPFEEAWAFVCSLGLKSRNEWNTYCKSGQKPVDIPTNPDGVYNKDWVNWGNWLGTKTVQPQLRIFLPFEEARAFARSLGLKDMRDWQAYCKANPLADIPAGANKTYAGKGWVSWGDWLGTGNTRGYYGKVVTHTGEITPVKRKQWARSVRTQYRRGLLSPEIVAACETTPGWSWKLLQRTSKFLPFEEARAFARSLGLKSLVAWTAYAQSDAKPFDIPASPVVVYAEKGWAGWADWLGVRGRSSFRPFEQARAFAQTLKLKNMREWHTYCKSEKKPDDIPNKPEHYYKDKGWVSWGDWLGTGNISNHKKTKAAGA